MYPVQMPSRMYLIFATKQRIIFFDPPCGLRWGDFFYHDRFEFCKSLSPLFPGLRETGFAELAYTNLIQLFCAFLNVVSIFPHKISFAVRKLLQLSNISLFWPISLPGGGEAHWKYRKCKSLSKHTYYTIGAGENHSSWCGRVECLEMVFNGLSSSGMEEREYIL